MALDGRSVAAIVLRCIGALGLLACPVVGSAQGTWSIISALQKPGEVNSPAAMAIDPAGHLYVADYSGDGPRIQARDTQGNWSVIAAYGRGPGQVSNRPALAVDPAGNLYVADQNPDRIQKRDAQGNWSVVAQAGRGLGQVDNPTALAADAVGNLYVADVGHSDRVRGYLGRIQKRDGQGNWSILAPQGASALAVDEADDLYVADPYGRLWKRDPRGRWSYLGNSPESLATDNAGNLYVAADGIRKRDAQGNWSVLDASHSGLLAADSAGNLYVAHPSGGDGVQKRDAQGNWSVIASGGSAPGQVYGPGALAVDTVGNLYVDDGRIQKRDAQGNWSVIAVYGTAPGQVSQVTALATDGGNLYVADHDASDMDRIQKRDVQGKWSVIATSGDDLGQVDGLTAIAADAAGNLYVVAYGGGGIQKRDAQGNWSLIDQPYTSVTRHPRALAVDAAGNLYIASSRFEDVDSNWDYRLYKLDTQGNWSEIAEWTDGRDRGTAFAVDTTGNLYVTAGDDIEKWDWSVVAPQGFALGQVNAPSGLAVDGAGNLYVADTGNNRVLKYTPGA